MNNRSICYLLFLPSLSFPAILGLGTGWRSCLQQYPLQACGWNPLWPGPGQVLEETTESHHISSTAGVESDCKMESCYTSFGELRDGPMAVQLGRADNWELRELLGWVMDGCELQTRCGECTVIILDKRVSMKCEVLNKWESTFDLKGVT